VLRKAAAAGTRDRPWLSGLSGIAHPSVTLCADESPRLPTCDSAGREGGNAGTAQIGHPLSGFAVLCRLTDRAIWPTRQPPLYPFSTKAGPSETSSAESLNSGVGFTIIPEPEASSEYLRRDYQAKIFAPLPFAYCRFLFFCASRSTSGRAESQGRTRS
jgi:hypothetical protein